MNHHLLIQRLNHYQNSGRYRRLHAFTGSRQAYWRMDSNQYVCFSGNDYLGLADHPEMVTAFKQAADQWGLGSRAANLISGYRSVHQEFEQAFAKWVNWPRALLLANGYMANAAVLTALVEKQDRIYQDHDNHASLLEAGRLSSAISRRYLHANCNSLERYLSQPHQGQPIIVSDGVFSMTGDVTPLAGLVRLTNRYQAKLIIDDAHGMGVLGKTGRGIFEYFELSPNIQETLCVYPLGKAFGLYGAMVVGSDVAIEALIQFARSYIYTTALPAALSCAGLVALKILQEETWRIKKLQTLIVFFRQKAQECQLAFADSNTAIQVISMTDNKRVMQIAEQLRQQGFLVAAMRPPTVKKPLLRISLRCDHTEQQITQLLNTLSSMILQHH